MMPGNLLRGLTFHVVGGSKMIDAVFIAQAARPKGLDTADIIVFQGGTDVNPSMYQHQPHSMTQPSDDLRDRMEMAVYAATPKQFHVGICRGAQLLHVLNGGCLWQHVSGHGIPHEVRYTNGAGVERGYKVSSTHHQMMSMKGSDAANAAFVWAWGNQTRERELATGRKFEMSQNHWKDPEVVFYKKTSSLCFQPHPEYFTPKDTRELFYKCLIRMVET
jgi:GMP synthase-like glutamine amidotransferase